MACFLVPATTGVVTTLLRRKFPERMHPEWLNAMLGGGSAMLAVEHYAHGEVVFYPPFLTSMKNPQDITQLIKEMVTVGGTMTTVILLLWLTMLIIAHWLSLGRTAVKNNSGGGGCG
jgi:hypothetical protein